MSKGDLEEGEDLYAILQLAKGKKSTPSEIKKAYRQLALKNHPDKTADEGKREEATREFQRISFAYSILSDEKKREAFDLTGRFVDEDDEGGAKNWKEYFDDLFGKIGVKDIEEFEKRYRESSEEENDVINAYIDAKGDMNVILDTVLCASISDEDRFRSIIEKAIKDKRVRAYKKFTKDDEKAKNKRIKAAEKEAKEAKELAKELGIDTKDGSLHQIIAERQKKRSASSFLDNLEKKYTKKTK